MTLEITSSAFSNGEMIPARYTCDGSDVSPDLSWRGVPNTAKSLALICDDPDAPMGTWVHWVLFNIPAEAVGLPAEISSNATLENGARWAVSSGRHPPLFFQALCAGYQAQAGQRDYQGAAGRGHAGAYPGRGSAYGQIQALAQLFLHSFARKPHGLPRGDFTCEQFSTKRKKSH